MIPMYVVKVMHGYIDKLAVALGKNLDNLLIFKDKRIRSFAKRIGGRVKPIQEVRPD